MILLVLALAGAAAAIASIAGGVSTIVRANEHLKENFGENEAVMLKEQFGELRFQTPSSAKREGWAAIYRGLGIALASGLLLVVRSVCRQTQRRSDQAGDSLA